MAGLPYLDGLGVLYRGGRGVPLRHRYSATKFLVPPITAVLLAGRAARARTSHERATAALVGAHGAASFLCAFPRADEEHVSWTLAPSLVGLTWASARLPLSSRTRHAARTIAWIWLGTAVVLSFAKPFRLWRSGRARLCRLPHFRGVVEDAATIAFVEQRANVLRTLAEDAAGATFLISPNAAQYWLLSGIPNPTPYDYPYATAFGHEGERETADAIRGGAITTAMIEVGDPHFAAWEVIRAAEETLTRVHDSDGTFYRGAKVSTPVLPRGQATAAR
jgi:hypothetical protein